MKQSFSEQTAIAAIENKNLVSVSAVLKQLGKSPYGGGNHALIKRIAAKHKLSTKHWLGQSWATGNHEPRKSNSAYFCVRKARISGEWLLRALLSRKIKTRQCEECKGTLWLSSPIPLEVHHVNGNPLDNRLVNLKVLCCNCHALTPNFGSKNRLPSVPS